MLKNFRWPLKIIKCKTQKFSVTQQFGFLGVTFIMSGKSINSAPVIVRRPDADNNIANVRAKYSGFNANIPNVGTNGGDTNINIVNVRTYGGNVNANIVNVGTNSSNVNTNSGDFNANIGDLNVIATG